MRTQSRQLALAVIGIVGGSVAGAIVAVNLIIFAGIGYDVSIAEVFRQNVAIGVVMVAILMAGPFVGFMFVRRVNRD